MTDRDDMLAAKRLAAKRLIPFGSQMEVVTIEAVGDDARSALEAGLRAVLAHAVAPTSKPVDTGRSTPLRGEADDLGSLFEDLVEDLLAQIEVFGDGLHDVVVDGVVRREDGGYVAWGYASGTLTPESAGAALHLLGTTTASDTTTQGVAIHAMLLSS